ncbi:MAG: Trx7/PDZ domain-containing (seleno)protein [Pirellulaceae bacterium]|nr:Trx7/PDZ domain-containing (seleno)protein [Pirellulaceae bacterium]
MFAREVMVAFSVVFLWSNLVSGQTREEKVRADKGKFETSTDWIYNNVDQGFAEAKRTGKPLLVTLRCIPCEECVKLDDDVIEADASLQELLKQFVCVRQISTNGLDLSLFQFDTDQSYAAFLFNADGTIYGRYGTRSDRVHHSDDVSALGLAKALEGALELHRDFSSHRSVLQAKRGQPPPFKAPELYPTLKGKYGRQLDFVGNVVKSCIHCHQIGDAQIDYHLSHGDIPDEVLFPFPHPKVVGLKLDPQQRATVLQVDADSAAAMAGLKSGDQIESLGGQPMLSLADVQWVLHHVPATGGKVDAEVRRDGRLVTVTIGLADGWRKKDDLAWRASTWQLRMIGIGGMVLKPVTTDPPRNPRTNPTRLEVAHVGQYAPHDRALHAGLRAGDVLVSFDGRKDFVRETDLLVHALAHRNKPLPVEVLRDGQRKSFVILPK